MSMQLKPDEIVCNQNKAHFSINRHSYYVVSNSNATPSPVTITRAANSNTETFDILLAGTGDDLSNASYYGVFEITLKQNPNGGGSHLYSTAAQMTVETTTGWHGSGYTPTIAKSTVDWQTYTGTISAVIYNNGTSGTAGEYTTSLSTSQAGNSSMFWASAGIFLRVKLVGGFNTTHRGHRQLQIVAKCCG